MITAQESPNGPGSSPPPCPAENSQCENASKDQTNNFNRTRCQFTYADGRRCSNERAYLCLHHGSRHRDRASDSAALAAPELVEVCSDLTTATNINRAVAQTYLLLAQGRISQKQAVAFGYLTQLLLQTVPGIRAEHVSAFGYSSWESRLKESLKQTPNEPTPPPHSHNGGKNAGEEHHPAPEVNQQPVMGSSSGKSSARESPSHESHGNQGLSCGQKVDQELSRVHKVESSGFSRTKKSEPEKATGALPPPPPQANPQNTKSKIRPFEQRVMSPDFGDLYRRGRALLDRKYDMTPEGRREAKALALEIELLNPAPAKPRRDKFGRVVDLVRRIRDHKRDKPAAKPAAAPLEAPDVLPSPQEPVRPALPSPQGLVRPGVQTPVESTGLLKCRHFFRHPGNAGPESAPPAPGEFPSRPSSPYLKSGSDPSTRVGHTVDWYAPASWSHLSPCGQHLSPCGQHPSRQEKWKREQRSMSNSRYRYFQHQNQSRSFWR